MTGPEDRRHDDRRTDFVSLADYTVPELRKALLTFVLLGVILILFTYMVHGVVVAIIAGIVAGVYLIPLQGWFARFLRNRAASSIVTIVVFVVPLLAILVYSWIEISGAASYLGTHRAEIVAGLNRGLDRLPYTQGYDLEQRLPGWVASVANQGAEIADELREAVDVLLVSVSVFLFTTFYILTDRDRLVAYLRSRVPGRYRSIVDPVSANIRAVIYGVLFGTFLTQFAKSAIILAMNLIWHVPLAVVLAIASFFIGLLPIVGSWTIYTPVALYLILWRGDVWSGMAMLLIGFIGNTLLISTYLRPKIAAEKSRVLNFYWMFIALVTGVYTFGLMGIIIGPVLIAVLKAILDAVGATTPAVAAAPAGAPPAPAQRTG